MAADGRAGRSRAGRLTAGVVALAAAVAGCGSDEKLSLKTLPMVPHARVVAERYGCPVTPDVCFRWAIVQPPPGRSAQQLKDAERRTLLAVGWKFGAGVTPSALAAHSPDRSTFISFETGAEEIADERTRGVLWGDGKLGTQLRSSVAAHRDGLAVTLEPGLR
jgi:hypothetical protein